MSDTNKAWRKAERIERAPETSSVAENILRFFDNLDRSGARIEAMKHDDRRRLMALDDIEQGVRHSNRGRKDIELPDDRKRRNLQRAIRKH
jgi:hypothetical protein